MSGVKEPWSVAIFAVISIIHGLHSGESGSTVHVDGVTYYYHRNSVNWHDASWHCEQNNSTLAIITNEVQWEALKKMQSWGKYWIGGYLERGNEWEWINGVKVPEESIHTDGSSRKHCGYLPAGHGIQYSSHVCGWPKPFLCERNDKRRCCSENLTDCYEGPFEELNWFEARTHCLQDYGTDLPTFTFYGENSTTVENDYWVGMRRSVWKWIGDPPQEIIFTKWYIDQPNDYNGQDCVMVDGERIGWGDEDCTEKFYLLCQTESPVMAPRTTRPNRTATTGRSDSHSVVTQYESSGRSDSHSVETQYESPGRSDSHSVETQYESRLMGIIMGLGVVALILLICLTTAIAYIIWIQRRKNGKAQSTHGTDMVTGTVSPKVVSQEVEYAHPIPVNGYAQPVYTELH